VARCINREVKAGRGSPHGGVFLDIAWIKEKLPNAPEHIKKKLPSMYHQFKQLADLDITKEPMEVGPTTHYAMGGVRVTATRRCRRARPVRRGRMRRRLHGANRLGGNSLSDLLVFGKRAGEYAAKFAKENSAAINDAAGRSRRAQALEPFERAGGRPKGRTRCSTICRT
jgi:succinate dehydrogenase / fumarate reductase flavoprotein subunit